MHLEMALVLKIKIPCACLNLGGGLKLEIPGGLGDGLENTSR